MSTISVVRVSTGPKRLSLAAAAPWIIAMLGGAFLGLFYAPYEVAESLPISRLLLLALGAIATAMVGFWRTRDITFAKVRAIHLLITFALLTGSMGLALNQILAIEGVPAFAIYCLLCAAFLFGISRVRADKPHS